MPLRGIHHVDLAVADVERSLAFYRRLLEPLGLHEVDRHPSYRKTEEVVVLQAGTSYLGLRPADGGEHRYYDVGVEHLAFEAESRDEVDDAHARCVAAGAAVHFAPEPDGATPEYYAFFAFDPDGFRVEVFCWPQQVNDG
jgi:catechol 2,3-dioxygenase-like lactoylglutathione lyase family enzyme